MQCYGRSHSAEWDSFSGGALTTSSFGKIVGPFGLIAFFSHPARIKPCVKFHNILIHLFTVSPASFYAQFQLFFLFTSKFCLPPSLAAKQANQGGGGGGVQRGEAVPTKSVRLVIKFS